MVDEKIAIELIQESLTSLHRAGTIKSNLEVSSDLVIMGTGNDDKIDSLGFVTLIMDIEDRLEELTKLEQNIILTEIENFNVNNPVLNVEMLSKHLVKISKTK